MEQNSKTRNQPFLTALARVYSRYGLTLEKDDFIERAYYVWRMIGNIATTSRRFDFVVPEDGVVDLPTDCEFVKSVTTTEVLPNVRGNTMGGKDFYNSKGKHREVRPDESMSSAESSVRMSKDYQYGTTVDYTVGDGYIQISSPTMRNRELTMYYSAIEKDEDGLPLLNDKEVEAIAAMVALQEAERRLFRGLKGSDILVQYLNPKADQLMAAAKSDEKISDDAIDKILDIKTSWDRKVYGRRFNMLK